MIVWPTAFHRILSVFSLFIATHFLIYEGFSSASIHNSLDFQTYILVLKNVDRLDIINASVRAVRLDFGWFAVMRAASYRQIWMLLFAAHASPVYSSYTHIPTSMFGHDGRCLYVSMRCNSVETIQTERVRAIQFGKSDLCWCENVIQGCIVPLLLAEWEVPSAADEGQ